MKIDMVFVWIGVCLAVILFQSHFTAKRSEWDVSYVYLDRNNLITYGQMAVVCMDDDLDWKSLQVWLQKEVAPSVTVLGTNKRESHRYWRPFWRRDQPLT